MGLCTPLYGPYLTSHEAFFLTVAAEAVVPQPGLPSPRVYRRDAIFAVKLTSRLCLGKGMRG